jgi:hypothetical protein
MTTKKNNNKTKSKDKKDHPVRQACQRRSPTCAFRLTRGGLFAAQLTLHRGESRPFGFKMDPRLRDWDDSTDSNILTVFGVIAVLRLRAG